MEKADLILNGAKDTIKAILPVVDDFERALAHIADDDASKEGVQLIYNKMMKVLEQRGLKPMEAKGQKFDENLHEAVTQFPAADESQKGMVVDVIEKGYYLNDKVLRYAKVVVAI
jgi:molecular chaperone GrpE